MKHFPKMDFLNFDLSKMKLGGFGAHGSAEAEGKRAARAARMTAAMGRFQRRQADAFARWAEARDRPAEPTGGAPIIDMEAPQGPGGAWTAPEPGAQPAAAPDHAAPAGVPFRRPRRQQEPRRANTKAEKALPWRDRRTAK